MITRTGFRLRGVPHVLLMLAEVSAALREEERQAWRRLIRVLGHEINNSLTPIKSIAGSLRSRIVASKGRLEEVCDFESGFDVIENRVESLNRFLQAYRQLMGLPSPILKPVSIAEIVQRVAQLETRISVRVISGEDLLLTIDEVQIQQALINLVRNATEASMITDAPDNRTVSVYICWKVEDSNVIIAVVDNGPGLTNADNLFVPFYTTKQSGTGIGLVLAQQIAEAHKGVVRLANRRDGTQGCCAELRLPLIVVNQN